MLTKNLRTHYLILKDWRQFAVTQEQYDFIKQDKQSSKTTDMFELRDADTKKMLFDGEFREIKEWRKISHGWSDRKFFCGFWNAHPIQQECNCQEKYGVSEHKFKAKAYELYGKSQMVDKIIWAEEVKRKEWNTIYMQDLSYIERNNCLELCK